MLRKGIKKIGHYLKVLRSFSWRRIEIKRESVADGAVTGSNLLLLLLVFLLPFFFLPITLDLFEFNKEVLFLAVTALLFLLWGVRIGAEKHVRRARTPYDGPLLLFFAAVLAAAVFDPSRRAALTALPTWVLLALPPFYWVAAANLRPEWGSKYLRAFLLSLVVLFLLLLGAFLGSSRWLPILPLFTLSPAGRPELAQVYFLTGLPVAYFLFKHRLLRQRFLMLAVSALLLGGVLLSNQTTRAFGQIFFGIKSNPAPVLDWSSSVSLVAASLKATPFFGQGLAHYEGAYVRFKPVSLNKTVFWNYRAVPIANTWFYLLVIGGIFLTLALGWLLVSFFRQLQRVPRGRVLYLVIFLFFLSSFFCPWTTSFFILPVFFLALTVEEEKRKAYHFSREIFFKVPAALFLTLSLLALFFLGRAYAAEVLYKRAYAALTQNEAAAAYNLLKRALGLNAAAGVYHRLYAQANLFLAQDLFQKGGGGGETEAQVKRLAEQAQREAKFLTEVWEPGSVESWEVRGGVSRSLLGLVPTAAKEAEDAFLRAQALSPNDPVWPWQLANLYLTLGETDKAVSALDAAAVLKDDWPQLYYTRARAYDAQKNEAKVLEMLNKLVSVTTPGTPERERALYLLEQRTKAGGREEGTGR